MIHINIDPVIFQIGPLSVRWYGLAYVVGIVVGLLIVWPYAKYKQINQQLLEKIIVISVIAGLVGARLYYVIQQPLLPYLQQPWRIFATWEGGMAFYGAIFGVVLTIIIMTWKDRPLLWKILDVAVLFGAVGQFFGRFGNIVNGDVIGYATTLPWGFIYDNPNSFVPSHTITYHPAAIYEAISNIILFSILWSIRKKFRDGMVFFLYLFGYSLGQIVVFFWRDNEIIFWDLNKPN